MKPFAPAALLLLTLGGCATTSVPRPTVSRAIPVALPTLGLEAVMGQNAAHLTQTFGQPDADVREGTARKLQFSSAICILDAYLYPSNGHAEPRVTWVDARQRDGSSIDRASCVAALNRRTGGK
ncbi:hypothetical protein ASE95_02075 [Sphingomonas sp. Leaf231]|uniref:hypothetical protein n=1 Tax=Sphingomonas sp. Leaf231 TaxID=1736301 RepID=UPI0006F4E0B3|nr:hypothetical protein [Sphingomonas sp. Leaf231]KQN93737.1 hypothetical protein ASE95_02075 [Sphingomonas sp. Leaf231]